MSLRPKSHFGKSEDGGDSHKIWHTYAERYASDDQKV